MNLNRLEREVLREMARRASIQLDSETALALSAQVAAAEVSRRENTGAGFYSTVVVGGMGVPRPKVALKSVSNVGADVDGLKDGMVFVVFFRDGVIDILEGAAITESTAGVDFSTVAFEVSREGGLHVEVA